MVVAGIDIGSTHGCVGVFHNGKVNIIANDQGFRTTPAYVTFEGDEVIIGDTAVNKLHSHAENTIFHLKRVLGKNHEDVVDQDYIQEWSFKVAKADDGAVHAATSRNGEPHHVTPVEFVSLLIKNLKDLAEDFTGESVDSVVLSIPAHATDKQKELLQEAADKAGVNVLTFISEPLAAAIAYGLDDSAKSAHPEYVLVFDIGGATHDVTLINADKGLFEIVATAGNDKLGGEDFTKALVEHCAKAFQRKTKLNVKDNKKASSRLRIACETAKRTLSTQTQVNIEIDSLMEGEDFSLKLSRPRFEELINDYVTAALKEVETLLESADVEKEHVDHVILVGGSSRIPLLQNAVKKYFDGKTTHLHLSPDEVVAHGATVEASLRADLANFETPKKALENVNVTPLTLSVALANGSVSELIHRETVLPATATETFTTSQDNQTAIFLQIYEGERVMAKDNTLLASLAVSGIAPAPKGEAEIEVTFAVNTKGALTITAVEQTAGKKTLEVSNDPKRLTAADVATIIQKAEDAAEEDDALLDALEDEDDEEAEEEVAVPAAAAPVFAPTGDLD
ncbi:Hsp70-like protein, partial [Globisporangium splendens]